MSKLTPCNFDTYMRMRGTASERGATVKLDMEDFGEEEGGWWITATYSDQEESSAMFKALTTECAC